MGKVFGSNGYVHHLGVMVLWVYVLCLVTQFCLTLYDPMEYSPPGSSVYGDSLGKNAGVGEKKGILEWLAMPFSRVSSQPRD